MRKEKPFDKLPAGIDLNSIVPTQADIKRGESMQWQGRSFYGSGAPYLSKVRSALTVSDPIKRVKMAKVVAEQYGRSWTGAEKTYLNFKGYDDKRKEFEFRPLQLVREALQEIGCTSEQIKAICGPTEFEWNRGN
jgi:hypothetical protein